VTSVIFSPDAALLASSSDDGNIKIWDISSSDNQCRQTLGGHFDFVTLFIFSPDSKLLASIPGYDTIMIWDTSSDSGCSLQTLGGHGGGIGLLIFSPNSKFLAAALDNGTIAIWNVASGSDSCQCPRILEGHSGSVNSIVFSHDSNLLASASPDCTVKIWDSDDCKCLHTFNLEQVASVLSFNDDSSYLETDTYIICLSPDLGTLTTNVSPKMTQCGGYGISSDSSWITWNSENVLWLPPDYRPTASAVSSSHVFLGCFSGHLLFFNFDTPKLQDVISGH
jgi:WD40 repeat protein